MIPFLVGVTGHRNLRDEDLSALERGCRRFFEELQSRYPHTPLVLLSPLAEGADRLAAKVALECGIRLHVPLPMPQEMYLADFAAEKSQRSFKELLARADHVFVLPLPAGMTVADARQPGPGRNKLYDAVGEFIARHSQILLAFWDGRPAAKEGGTADIVNWRLNVLPRETASPLHSPDPVHTGPVVQLVTPRQGEPAPDNPCTTRWHYPEGAGPKEQSQAEYDAVFRRLDAFNGDAVRKANRLAAAREQSEHYLIPASEMSSLPPALAMTRRAYATADALAGFYQRRTLWTLVWIFTFVFLAVVIYEACSKLLHNEPVGLLLYPLGLGVAYLLFHWARWHDYQNNYQDYRALAEGLRVQFFWRVAGLATSAEANYLRQHRSELHWIRQAVRICWALQGGETTGLCAPKDEADAQRRLQLARTHWVEDQHAFFHRRKHAEEAREQMLRRILRGLIWFGLGAALLLGILLGVPNPVKEELRPWLRAHPTLEALLYMVAGIPLVGAAMIHSYLEKRALNAHVKQYAAMDRLFVLARERLSELLAAPDSRNAILALIEEIGKEALVENGDWVLLHRERPLEVPHAR